jgi:hypothetical protein
MEITIILHSDTIVTPMHEKTSEIQIIVIARDLHKGKSMIEHRERQICGKFKIDTQEYDTNDIKKKLERVDVSPFGTEGIFIDVELPERNDEKK